MNIQWHVIVIRELPNGYRFDEATCAAFDSNAPSNLKQESTPETMSPVEKNTMLQLLHDNPHLNRNLLLSSLLLARHSLFFQSSEESHQADDICGNGETSR